MQKSVTYVCQGITIAHRDRARSEWDAAGWGALRRLQLDLTHKASKLSCPADSMHVQHETAHPA